MTRAKRIFNSPNQSVLHEVEHEKKSRATTGNFTILSWPTPRAHYSRLRCGRDVGFQHRARVLMRAHLEDAMRSRPDNDATGAWCHTLTHRASELVWSLC